MVDDINPIVFHPDSKPYGKGYGEWAEEWIKWVLSIPKPANPIIDTTGKNCAEKQTSPVWFLVGTFGNSVKRQCQINHEMAIFFPIIEKECSLAEEGDQLKTEEDLCNRARDLMDVIIDMRVMIDGISLKSLNRYRARSRVFDLVFPPNNVYGVSSGTTRSVTDGYWLLIKPMTIGNHIIHINASSSIPKGPAETIARRYVEFSRNIFRTEVLYELNIVDSLR